MRPEYIAAGFFLLFWGRRLFWFFVVVLGFLSGSALAASVWGQSGPWFLAIAAAGGLIGALAALFLQRFAIRAAGFMAGGYLAYYFSTGMGAGTQGASWLIYLIGGIIGLFAASLLFDWALIVLSALTGAALMAQGINPPGEWQPAVLGMLFLLGIAVQAMGGGRNKIR